MPLPGDGKLFLIVLLAAMQSSHLYSQATLPALHAALDNATTSKERADICFTISLKQSDNLKVDSALYYANKVNEYSTPDNYEIGKGKYSLATARALNLRDKRKEAAEVVVEALRLFTKNKSYQLLGMSYLQRAMSFIYIDPENSRKCYWQAIHSYTLAGDSAGIQRSYMETGRFYNIQDVPDSSAIYLTNALTLAERLNNKFLVFNASSALGSLYQEVNDTEKAIKFLDLALKNQGSVSKVVVRIYQVEFTQCLIEKQEYKRADSMFKEIETMNDLFRDEIGRSDLAELKGEYYFNQKKYPEALEHFRYAFNRRFGSKSYDENIMTTGIRLAETEFEIGMYDSTILHMREVIAISKKGNALHNQIYSYELLSRVYEKIGKADSALFYFRNYIRIKDTVLALQRQKAIIDISTKYETAKKEQAILILEKDAESKSLQLQLQDEQLLKQYLEADKKNQQLELISKQNEINKLDASQKALFLQNEKQENDKNQARLKLLEQEAAYQKLLASKQNQEKRIVYISIAALLALGSYTLYRYIRKRRLQNQREVLNERLRISRELHDEIGSTLSGIAMYSHLTREQMKAAKTHEVEKSLTNIQQSAGEMVTKLSDIVWLVNPEKDSMQNLVERLEQYAEDMAQIKDIDVKISVSPKLAGISLPVESRRNIYLFCKEAINNAVKYSNATVLEVTLMWYDNRKIEIMVSDNGSGFDITRVKKGNGLDNMKLRADDIGAEYMLESKPGAGTRVSLSLKFT